MSRALTCISILLLLFVAGDDASAVSDQEAKMREVIGVLDVITKIPEDGIPTALLHKAEGIAIIPAVVKVGLVVGGRYGKGIITVRKDDGSWSNPLFLSLSGGSVGWQIGAQSTDVILVFKSRDDIDDMIKGKFTLGVDASVIAGSVGGEAATGPDMEMKSDIYSYSINRGLCAGIALDGARLKIENKDDARYYGSGSLQAAQIIMGDGVDTPASAKKLHEALNGYIK